MADAISIQELIDARTDAKTLEEAVNGDAVTTVLSRLGETYPTLSNALNQIDSKLDSADTQIKQGITNLFENGGLPATPFATKALMTASALIDGKYAMVTNDAVNNGLYVKTGGSWVKSGYDPVAQSKSYTDSVTEVETEVVYDFGTGENLYIKDNNIAGLALLYNKVTVVADVKGTLGYIDVVEGNTYAFNVSSEALLISFSNDTSELSPIKIATVDTSNTGVQIVKAPLGYSKIVFNAAYGGLINVVDRLKIVKADVRLTSFNGASVVSPDTVREVVVSTTNELLYKEELGSDNSNLLGEYIIKDSFILVSSYLLKPAVGVGGDNEVHAFPLIEGETYSIRVKDDFSLAYVGGYPSLLTEPAEEKLTALALIASPAANVKTFVVPSGINFGYVMTKYNDSSIHHDASQELWINKGENSSYEDKFGVATRFGEYLFKDSAAHKRIDNLLLPSVASPLNGKRWVAIGDSITEFNIRATRNYHDYVNDDVGGSMTIFNYGISGTRFLTRHNVADTITQTNIDFITVMLGVNDVASNADMGEFLSTDTATISGALNTLLLGLFNKFPTTKIAMFTPTPMRHQYGEAGSKGDRGYNQEDVVNLIKRYCDHYSVPCLDLFHTSNIRVFNGGSYDALIPDGLHPNAAGQRLMADRIRPFLESI